MHIDRMYKHELEAEIERQSKYLSNAIKSIDKLHGVHDYSDEVAKYFHLGRVGFRRDTKRQGQTIERAIKNGVESCRQYEIRDNAKGIITECQNTIDYIVKKSPNGDIENYTKQMILTYQKQLALSSAPELTWVKSKGQFGTMYTYGKFEVEKVDTDFVSIRKKGNLLTHCKTIKEAKAIVSLFVSKEEKECLYHSVKLS